MNQRRALSLPAPLGLSFSLVAMLALFGAACGSSDESGPKAARILSFTASPEGLSAPGAVTIAWETEHVHTLSLSQDGEPLDVKGLSAAKGSLEVHLEESATFSLLAGGRVGVPATATLRVQVGGEPGDGPVIGSFSAPAAVAADESGQGKVPLSWSGITGAVQLAIEAEPGAGISLDPSEASGELVVTIEADTIFTMVARNAAGDVDRKSVSVRLLFEPTIKSFTVDRSWVGAGESVEASWITEGADSVELWLDGVKIEELDGNLLTGSFEVSPFFASTLELRAINDVGVATETIELNVGAPLIVSFGAEPERLWLGETVAFSWEIFGASEIQIFTGDSEELLCETTDVGLLEEGSCDWIFSEAGTFPLNLIATNGSGRDVADSSVTVGTGPSIELFTVTPLDVSPGDEVTVSWVATADPAGEEPALDLRDDRGGSYPISDAAGSLQIPIIGESGTVTFELEASTTHAFSTPAVATATVVVHGTPQVALTVSPTFFDDSESEDVRFEWTTTSAHSLILYDVTEGEPVEVQVVPEEDRAAGSYSFVPERPGTFRLVAMNGAGATASDEASFIFAPMGILSFEPDEHEIVAGQAVELRWASRMGKEFSLSLFDADYIRGESDEGYLDVSALGATRVPLTSACGTALPTAGCTDVVALDFEFPFDGEVFEELRLYGNGFASFELEEKVANSGTNFTFPFQPGPGRNTDRHVHLAPFWDQLQWDETRYPTGNLYVLHREDPTAGKSVVLQWKDVGLTAHPTASLNFEIILWESGAFEYRYGAMDPGTNPTQAHVQAVEGRGATIGYQTPSHTSYDVRQFQTDVQLRGTLAGRTFTYVPPPAAAVGPSGTFTWHPYLAPGAATATFRIERDGASEEQTVNVTVHERPEFRLDQRPPAQTEVNTDFRIGWSGAFANKVEVLDGEGVVRCAATTPQRVASDFCDLRESTEGVYEFTIRATGALGTTSEKLVEIKVHEPFGIDFFEADELSLEHGESVTLSWMTSGVSQLSLFADDVEVPLSGSPSGPGSLVVSDLDSDTTFTLRAFNSIGAVKEEKLLVEMWKVRLRLTSDKSRTRPGEPVTVSVEALPLDGGEAPVVFGTLPMTEVTDGPGFVDISKIPDLLPLVIQQDTYGHADVQLPEGFTFPYFGVPRSSLRVFVSGFLSFDMDAAWTNQPLPLPASSVPADKVHMSPFWEGLRIWNQSSIWAHQLDPDTFIVQWTSMTRSLGSTLTSNYDLNFQVVLHRDGSFEYRYGEMLPPPLPSQACRPNSCVNEANGSRAVIGYQGDGGLVGLTLHRGGRLTSEVNPTFPGGLSNRVFRYQPLVGSGQVTYRPIVGGEYVLCTMSNERPACKSLEIEAPFGFDSVELTPKTINFGQTAEITWKSHGATALSIQDRDGTEIFHTTDPATLDSGSFTLNPTSDNVYRLELTARSNRAVVTRELTFVRAAIQVSAPASTPARQPVTIAWTLTTPDPSLQPIMVTPMEEDQGLDFYDLDIKGTPGVTEIFGANVSGTTASTTMKDLVFEDGFTFDYFGKSYDRLRLSVNGYLSFDPTVASQSSNSTMPNATVTYKKMHLAPFWDQLATFTYGRVLAKLVDPDTYVIQWSDVSLARGLTAANPASLNFMVVLRRNGDFEYRFGAMLAPATPLVPTTTDCFPNTCVNEVNGSSATIGYQHPSGEHGHGLLANPGVPNPDFWPMSGGLTGRSWKFTRRTASGSVQVAPWNTSTYTMCAVNSGTDDFICPEEPVEIKVDWGIASFDAGPTAPRLGDPVSMSWQVSGLEKLRVLANGVEIKSYTGAGIPATGSLTHTPSVGTLYTLEGTSLDRVVTETRQVWIKAFELEVTAPIASYFPGTDVNIGFNLTPNGSGPIHFAAPMGEIGAGAGQPGAFHDISGVGTKLDMGNTNNGYAPVDLPFSFPYFGESFGKMQVFVDGYITFDTATANGQATNTTLPNSGSAQKRVHLAPFWDDLFVRGPDTVWTHQVDADTFIVQWKNFNRNTGSSASTLYDLNFQVVLFADGSFDYRYAKMAAPPPPFSNAGCWPDSCELEANGSSATIGYQTTDGMLGYQLHFGGNAARDIVPFDGGLGNRSFRFQPATSGTAKVRVGATKEHRVCARAGDYYDCRTVTIRAVADPGDLMFTELMIDPAGGAAERWFELRNLSKDTIELEGFTLQSDGGSHVISNSVMVGPGDFVVFAASELPGFTADYLLGANVPMSKTVDTLELIAGTATIASISWGGSWQIPMGRSLELDPSHHWGGVVANDSFASWCDGGAAGTPGRLGAGCSHMYYDLDPAARGQLIDLSAIGTRVPAFRNTIHGLVKLDAPGFFMPLFQEHVDTVWASANGWLSFAPENPGGDSMGPPRAGSPKLPNYGLPRPELNTPAGPLVVPFWNTPLPCETAECIFRYYYGEVGGENVLVTEWKNVKVGTNTETYLTVQAQLWESGDIVFAFGDYVSFDEVGSTNWHTGRGASAWSGIENLDRSDYLTAILQESVDLDGRTFYFKRK